MILSCNCVADTGCAQGKSLQDCRLTWPASDWQGNRNALIVEYPELPKKQTHEAYHEKQCVSQTIPITKAVCASEIE
jgi:hypothetical protein